MEEQTEIEEAIKKHQGAIVAIGTLAGHPSDGEIYTLVRYDGDEAVVLDAVGGEKNFPASEIFDVDAVKNTAVEIHARRIIEQMDKDQLN